MYFIPKESKIFTPASGKPASAELDARQLPNGGQPFALSALTLEGFPARAKLQKEHSLGHTKAEVLTGPTIWNQPFAAILGLQFVTKQSFAKDSEESKKMKIHKFAAWLLALFMSVSAAFATTDAREEQRVKDAGEVMKEILNIPDDIPQDLLDKAECVVILPSVKKGAFGIGGSYGRGVMICRSGEHYTGPWGPPAMYALEGVSIGFQLGGQATDFVLLVMNPQGARSLLSSKVKLGADASAAAGPKGRTAEGATDVVMQAEILSYSRNKGLFAGISLEGSTLRSDGNANEKLYGKKLSAKEIIVEHKVAVPACARELVSLLDKKSPKNKSDPKSLE
jgi:SH3 domain-containing YSC84-like protein 1